MKTKFVILSFLALCVSAVNAQELLFQVIASKGENKVVSSGKESKMASGNRVYTGAKIKVVSGGYVSMKHNTGKVVELRTPGTFDASQLASKYNKKSAGFASKYSNFVLAGMDASSGTGNANSTGAVHRGNESPDININLFTANIKGTSRNYMLKSVPALVKWDLREGGKSESYVVSLKDLEDNVIFTTEVKGSSAQLDLTNTELKDAHYLLVVSGKDNAEAKSKPALIEFLSDEEKAAKESDLSKLKAELDLTAAIDNLVMARYYEEQKMYLNAVGCYEKAIEIAPEVESYKTVYTNFLARIGVTPTTED